MDIVNAANKAENARPLLIALASTSPVKIAAMKKILDVKTVFGYKVDIEMAEQPMNGAGAIGADMRLEKLRAMKDKIPKVDMYVAIENSIIQTSEEHGIEFCELCVIHVYIPEFDKTYESQYSVYLHRGNIQKYILQAMAETPFDYKYRQYGLAVTVGSVIHKYNPKIPADNWIEHFNSQTTREDQIGLAFASILSKYDVLKSFRSFKELAKAGCELCRHQPISV